MDPAYYCESDSTNGAPELLGAASLFEVKGRSADWGSGELFSGLAYVNETSESTGVVRWSREARQATNSLAIPYDA